MVRTPSCDKNGLKKGTWTPAEDKKLKDYVDKHGCWNWRQLPKHAGLSRCGKSCRLRWMNYLRPNVKRGNFTHEEDKLILELHESLGNRWSAIATHLPGRTDNEIKNHWHSSLKNRATNFSSKPIVKKSFKRASNLELKTNEAFNIDSNNILESTPIPMCPQVPSSPLSSLANTVSSSTNFKKFGVEDDACSKQVIGESMGDFWTEPFLQDFDYNFSNTSDNFLRPLPELGILSPPCPIDKEDTFWFYCLHTEHIHGFQ